MVHLIKSQRGGMKLVDNYNYIYRVDQKSGEKTYWKCEYSKCKARLHTVMDVDKVNVCICKTVSEHSHPSNPSKTKMCDVKAKLKSEALSSPLSSRMLIEQMASSMDESTLSLMSNASNLARSVRSWRQRVNQSHPIPVGRCGYSIPQDYKFLKNGEQFLIFDSGEQDTDRILIFGAQDALEDLASSKYWACDSTFKCFPENYFQLCTLHMIVGHVSVPRLFILLPNKNEVTYIKLLTILKCINKSLCPETLMMDFEKTIINAFQTVFPLTGMTGCLFHMSKNIYRHIVNLGLNLRYSKDVDFNLKMKCFTALAFLPIPDVIDGFIELADDDDLPQEFISYFETHFIGGERGQGEGRRRVRPTFPIELWNVFSITMNHKIRTSDCMEAAHNGLQSSITTEHPNLWKLIDHLKREEGSAKKKKCELERGDNKIINKSRNATLQSVMSEYDPTQKVRYLKSISWNLHSF
ncbi:uncharacterized protein asrij isoform X1 [Lepeophtheirus salmonis]|uniref:Putative LOC100898192 [Metaseiulus occidentalis] n=1 Tax=Lepeophtheirus salmonis TaxID=72036 RepID=A0A0K2UE97_LEPSM|nr:uncharacterized protein LOC121124133 [Lepeophtheirus salmonis]